MNITQALKEKSATQRPMIEYAPGYFAYADEDEDRGGYFILYCKGEMPPHQNVQLDDLESLIDHLGEEAMLTGWTLIEVDQ